jgi:hypothetical protein
LSSWGGRVIVTPQQTPDFNWIRSEVLCQLSLDAYASGDPGADPPRAEVADGLAPEPFMLELSNAEVAISDWLGQVLSGGDPNAAHTALAAVAREGAKVWTVNFDSLIERADPTLI